MLAYIQKFQNFLDEAYDDRLEHYPLMGSTYKVSIIVLIYLIFIKYIGPKFMESRKPYELKNIMQIYNGIQVILNSLLTIYGAVTMFKGQAYNITCPMVDFSHSADALCLLRFQYIYFLLKVLDLMDTVFIILKKNNRQASVLHIYHHTIMAIGTQVNLQYYPGGCFILSGYMNSIVHVIMYSYFFITSIRPELKSSLWWKKYITQMQMIQFVVNMCHYTVILRKPDCMLHPGWTWWGVSQNIIFLILFLNFYIRNYDQIKRSQNNKTK